MATTKLVEALLLKSRVSFMPVATSRFNMDTQIGIGATLFARSRLLLHFSYRFSHISNGGIGSTRNPGLEVQSLLIGMRLFAFRR